MYMEIYLTVLFTGIACVVLFAWGIQLTRKTEHEHRDQYIERHMKKAA
ncbi:MAG: hypothetical protein HZA24_04945 [Nitrospirae bacterium]|nr:hypothetical protein [Nitrospirota bacterium]